MPILIYSAAIPNIFFVFEVSFFYYFGMLLAGINLFVFDGRENVILELINILYLSCSILFAFITGYTLNNFFPAI